MVNYDKCPNCKKKGLYLNSSKVCCFCGQSIPNKRYGEMKRKELKWHIKNLEERLEGHTQSELYENNIDWRNMTAKLNGMNIKKEWRVKYLTVGIAFIALIIALFKP